jgi:hypothetical protein
MSARAGFGGGLEGLGGSMGGVRGDMAAGQNGKGLMGRSAGGCRVVPLSPVCSGRILVGLSSFDKCCGGQGQ